MRAVSIIAAAGLAAAVAAVAVVGAGLKPQAPEATPAADAQGVELRWHRPAGQASERQGRATTAEAEPATASVDKPAEAKSPFPPLQPPAAKWPPSPSRAIAPSVVAIPQIAPEELERVPPRPPLSEPAPALRATKPPPKPLLFRPVAQAAGVIVAGGRTVTIAGIEPLADAEMCPRAAGGEWNCGRAARTAFRGLLRGRAVTCDFPQGQVPDEVTVSCSLGRLDIGAWLVEHGWARAGGDTYMAEARTAREAARGIYGPGPAELPPPSSAAAIFDEDGGTAAIGGAPEADVQDAATPPAAAGPASISILPPVLETDRDAVVGEAAPSMGATVHLPASPATGPFPEAPPAPSGSLSPLPPPSSPPR